MSSGFITETELAEARQKRQDEWEKVRQPDQPLERPEEAYDPRPLYDRLKEQKMKKDMEYEEAHKLKNLIRGLDDDEVEFLDLVDRTKMKVEKQQQIEEQKELNDFRQRVATLQEKSVESKIQTEFLRLKPKPTNSNQQTIRPSQKSLLGAIVRKRKYSENENGISATKTENDVKPEKQSKLETITNNSSSDLSAEDGLTQGALKCIGFLPGIGRYKDSSDSEISSDSEEEAETCNKFDVFGRINVQRKKTCEDSE